MENEFISENLLEISIELKVAIRKVFGVNIDVNTRKRVFVDARRIYAKILREQGFSFASIGYTLKKDHATIIHYLRYIDHIFVQDKALFDKYVKCKDILFNKVDENYTLVDDASYRRVYKELEQKIGELQEKYINLHHRVEKYKRIESIIDLVNERTDQGDEELIEYKIRTMFNGLKKE